MVQNLIRIYIIFVTAPSTPDFMSLAVLHDVPILWGAPCPTDMGPGPRQAREYEEHEFSNIMLLKCVAQAHKLKTEVCVNTHRALVKCATPGARRSGGPLVDDACAWPTPLYPTMERWMYAPLGALILLLIFSYNHVLLKCLNSRRCRPSRQLKS